MKTNHIFYPVVKDLEITDIISFFYAEHTVDINFPGEIHDFWEFIYVEQGQALITAGEKQYILKKRELVFHKPGEFHSINFYENIPTKIIVSAFVCKSPCMQYFEHRFSTLTAIEQGYLYNTLKYGGMVCPWASYNSNDQKSPTSEKLHLIQSNLEILLLLLIQRKESPKIESRVISYTQMMHSKNLTQQIKDYLQKHLTENLTLEQISNDLSSSLSNLKQLFRQNTNQGIMDYFIDLKMNEAKRLMRDSELNISQISYHLGYSDISYFSRLFKRRQHMSPTEYLNSLK